jgi:hypothetical protein
MSVDAMQPALNVPVVHPKQDANGESGRDPRREGKPRKSEREQQDPPQAVLNALGQLTGKNINITA